MSGGGFSDGIACPAGGWAVPLSTKSTQPWDGNSLVEGLSSRGLDGKRSLLSNWAIQSHEVCSVAQS